MTTPDQTPTVTALRFVYGKLVREPGGPVTPGFEHRATSISQGLPESLLPCCRPQEILGNQSVQALVHPQREHDGALLFRPACCDGRRYMLATCVRARPESGVGGLSRTHTQLVTFVFSEADWNAKAPRLIANAGRWLRAEPDTVAFHEQHRDCGDYPPVPLGPEELTEVPPCASGPLPKLGSLLWHLTGALERADESLVCGAADRIDSVGTFLRALACATALLPEPLRIYLTAAAGFAEVQDRTLIALQYLPQAPALPRTEPGLLEQLAAQLVGEDPAADQQDWQRSWQSDGDPVRVQCLLALAAPKGWRTAPEARRRLTQVFDHRIACRSVAHLAAWLDGTRPEAPARPALQHPNTGKDWILKLTRRLNEGSPGGAAVGLARALAMIATLIDTDGLSPGRQQAQAGYWARAWREASKSQSPRSVLRWSALSASPLADDPADAAPREIGYLRDFRELRVIAETLQRAKAESPADAALIDQTLGNSAFNRRLDELRRRAGDVLIHQPLAIIDLAASFPALLAPRPGHDARRAERLAETVHAINVAAGLYAWTEATLPEWQANLAAAARQVAVRSLKMDHAHADLLRGFKEYGERELRTLLRHYWQWALAPDADRDQHCTLWSDAIRLGLYLQVKQQGLPRPIRLLFDTCQQSFEELTDTHPDWTRLESASLFDLCLETVTDLGEGPAKMAADLFRSLPDLPHLAPGPSAQFITCQLGEALNRGICKALQDQQAGPPEWIADFLPVFSGAIGDWLADAQNRPTQRLTRRLLALANLVLERLRSGAGPPPRQPLTDLLTRLDQLLHRTSQNDSDLAAAIDPLARAMVHCILAWAEADPPAPWFDPTWFEAEAEPFDSPIRMSLSRRLGFPRCTYFAALGPWPDRACRLPRVQARSATDAQGDRVPQRTPGLLKLPLSLTSSIDKVIAYGAARTWRGLFERGQFQPDYLDDIFKTGVTDEVLCAFRGLAQSASSSYRCLIDDETWFAVCFGASLVHDQSPLGRVPIPETLRVALLSRDSRHDSSYALQLGRMIATSGSAFGGRLKTWFHNPKVNTWVATRVLCLEGGWNDFAQLDPQSRRHSLLRLLFLLGLIVRCGSGSGRVEIDRKDIEHALRLAPRKPEIQDEMARFFKCNWDFAIALRHAMALANIDGLACWRRAIQPPQNQ